MLIDWFTVTAQVVNFLLLVWLLKRFLYRPILNAIDARETRIAAELADAEAKKAEAIQQRDEYQHKIEEFDEHRAARLDQVTDEVKTERLRLMTSVREETNDLRTRQQEAIKSERRSLSGELTRRTREEVFSIARKALTDLADATLEERMVDVFLRRLRELPDADLAGIKTALNTSKDPLFVRTSFSLSAEYHTTIETAINATLGAVKPVQFETEPDLVSGIELSVNGQRLGWSIADYLGSLSGSIDSLLESQSKAAITDMAEKRPGVG